MKLTIISPDACLDSGNGTFFFHVETIIPSQTAGEWKCVTDVNKTYNKLVVGALQREENTRRRFEAELASLKKSLVDRPSIPGDHLTKQQLDLESQTKGIETEKDSVLSEIQQMKTQIAAD
jgi:hypothetical protein